MKYYVYHAYGLNGELLYVGKGSGDRYKHCNSGVSSASKYSENVRLCMNHLVRSNMHQNDIFTNIFTYDKIKTSTYTLKLSEDFVRDIHCSMELKG